ncbi:MAG: hypothetical protein JO199_10750 [Candidatus Eremiobacteraeota bacterium]|nr:hypothetical protein [Candidatus Eremiobacteraeota bacterium]
MAPIALLEEKIPDFKGYAEPDNRRRSDELVRSFLGEALAEAQERLGPLPAAALSKIGDLEIRTAFANQRAFHAFEQSIGSASNFDDLLAADASVVELAERAASIDRPALDAYLDEVTAALDRRDRIMSGA